MGSVWKAIRSHDDPELVKECKRMIRQTFNDGIQKGRGVPPTPRSEVAENKPEKELAQSGWSNHASPNIASERRPTILRSRGHSSARAKREATTPGMRPGVEEPWRFTGGQLSDSIQYEPPTRGMPLWTKLTNSFSITSRVIGPSLPMNLLF